MLRFALSHFRTENRIPLFLKMLLVAGPNLGRVGAESPASRGCTAPDRGLDHDGSGHVRMQGAKILVDARCRERERVFVVGVHHLGSERLAGRRDGVRDVVLVDPGDGGPGFDGQVLRTEGEIVDLHHRLRRGGSFGHGGERSQQGKLKQAGEERRAQRRLFHCCASVFQPLSGASTIASRCWPGMKVILAMPSTVRSLSSSTFMGPGDGAAPGAGCGKAVERAVWKVTLPSTFSMIWWMWPLSTVTEPKRLR